MVACGSGCTPPDARSERRAGGRLARSLRRRRVRAPTGALAACVVDGKSIQTPTAERRYARRRPTATWESCSWPRRCLDAAETVPAARRRRWRRTIPSLAVLPRPPPQDDRSAGGCRRRLQRRRCASRPDDAVTLAVAGGRVSPAGTTRADAEPLFEDTARHAARVGRRATSASAAPRSRRTTTRAPSEFLEEGLRLSRADRGRRSLSAGARLPWTRRDSSRPKSHLRQRADVAVVSRKIR